MFAIEVKSHRYLRTAMVLLLVGLGAAVFYQTWRQGFELLGSVSAYYYTPAQAIFVGALIGLGACMIALRGTTDVEDVFLNIGGMFAAVVAIVPIARSEDYSTAVRACEQTAGPLLTRRASDLDCPTVRALADATRANIENNTVALLVVGALALLATVFFARRDSGSNRRTFWWGFLAAFLVYGAGAAAFWLTPDWYVDRAHYVAGIGLLVCVIVVAIANAVRHQREQGRDVAVSEAMRRPDRYAWLAWAMVTVAVVGGVAVVVNAFALFWLEVLVALLFALFWMVQTIEQLDHEPQSAPES
ncbi:MAG: hypothetical protein ACRDT6_00920 [Micromonosporaceae bacterium]